MVYEDLLKIKTPNPRPLHEFIKSREDYDELSTTLGLVSKEFLEMVPMLGGIRYGSSILGPGVDYIHDVAMKAGGKEIPESGVELVAKGLGVPGTNQIAKMQRAADRGEDIYGIIFGRYTEPIKFSGEDRFN